ncbi:hypothetical protein Hanom_Chr09g00789641 [Helianthus anomalus]
MGKTFLLKPDYNQNSALNDPQRRFAPRARLDILGNKYAYITLLTTCYCLRTPMCLPFSVIALLANHSYLCYLYCSIMSGRVDMTQAQLAALINK